ncbi:MAG: hypothetical protein IJ227_04730, partial [Mogibacterium sp.]|nr:hypothetical protein [Mogibacterium sp.]
MKHIKNKALKRFLAFVLSAAMIVTYMPTSMIAYAVDGTDTQVKQQEEQQEAVKEQPQEETVVEEPAAEESAPEDVSEPETEDTTEASEPAPEEAEEAAPVEEGTPEKEDDGLNKEKMTFAQDGVNSVNVKVVAEPGTFPEGTKMKVTSVKKSDVKDAVEGAMGGEVSDFRAVDITFYTDKERDIQPKKDVKVLLTTSAFKSDEDLAVVHVEDPDQNKAEVMDLTKATDKAALFSTDGFSIYAIVSSGEDARVKVVFKGLNDAEIDTMYVKEKDD